MYDSGKVITGIIIFVLLMVSPIIYNFTVGNADYVPKPEKPAGYSQCVMDKEYMTSYHMDLLNTWRDDVVRGGTRTFQGIDGKTYDKSLTNTCLDCHKSKKNFCDKCHDYAGVVNYCWDCHLIPQEVK
jgi:hypothetical protein